MKNLSVFIVTHLTCHELCTTLRHLTNDAVVERFLCSVFVFPLHGTND